MFKAGERVIYIGRTFLKDRCGQYAKVAGNSKKGLVKIRFLDGYEARVEEKILRKEGV